jgi:hypothetical protein
MKNQSSLTNLQTVNLQPAANSGTERKSRHATRSLLSKVNVLALAAAIVLGLGGVQTASASVTNPSFELPDITATCGGAPCFDWVDASQVGWNTTATDNLIEIWRGSYGGVFAYAGDQHVELNATQTATLYQYVTGFAFGQVLRWQFAHRGRFGMDTMAFVLTDDGGDGFGDSNDSILFSGLYSDDKYAWVSRNGEITALGNTIRISLVSVSSAYNIPDGGNFVDDVGLAPVPEPCTLAMFGSAVLGLGGLLRRRLLG